MRLRVRVEKVGKAQLQFASIRQDVTERICHGNGGIPIWAIPESVTYTVETDGEWGFDWLGVRGRFYKFNRE